MNLVDFVGLEALRVFEPRLYRALPGAKQTLTGDDPYRGLRGEQVQEENIRIFEQLLNLVPEEHRGSVEALLHSIFPPTAALTGRFASDEGGRERWAREARVCSSEYFSRYFQLAVPEVRVGDVCEIRSVGHVAHGA